VRRGLSHDDRQGISRHPRGVLPHLRRCAWHSVCQQRRHTALPVPFGALSRCRGGECDHARRHGHLGRGSGVTASTARGQAITQGRGARDPGAAPAVVFSTPLPAVPRQMRRRRRDLALAFSDECATTTGSGQGACVGPVHRVRTQPLGKDPQKDQR